MDQEIIVLIIGIVVGLIIGIVIALRLSKQQIQPKIEKFRAEQELEFTKRLDDVRKESNERQRSSLKGKIGEQMAPLFPEFTERYEPADARFIGTPIDYVIFKNMSKFSNENKEPLEIVFVEVKSGNPSLTPKEKAVKEAVENQRVKFETLRLDTENNSPT